MSSGRWDHLVFSKVWIQFTNLGNLIFKLLQAADVKQIAISELVKCSTIYVDLPHPGGANIILVSIVRLLLV